MPVRRPPSISARSVRAGLIAIAAVAIAAGVSCDNRRRRMSDTPAVEVVTMPPLPDGGRGGPPSSETEPNDSDDVATVLAIGGTVHGKIEADDVDHYRIDVEQAGALSVTVEGRETLDAELQLLDAHGDVLASSERGGVRIREGVPNFGVAPGRYTAVVRARKPPPPRQPRGKGRKPVEPPRPSVGPYEITAALAAPAVGLEREPDDDRGEANDLIAGESAGGYIGWAGDVDLWKVSLEALSAKNSLDIEVTEVEGIALSIEILDGVGKSIVTRRGVKGARVVVRGFAPTVPQGAPPFHYLAVKADRSNPETAYRLSATPRLIEPDAELEPNDTPETAMAVPSDRKAVRARWSTGDIDCFAIAPAEAARTIEVSIETPRELDLAIDARVDGQLVGQVDHPGKGAAEKLVAPVPASAHAAICVRGKELAADEAYQLAIDEGVAAP